MKIYTDGATLGWNGKLGTVSRVGLGVFIPELGIKKYTQVDGISNNEAEFKALIFGIETAKEQNIKKVQFFLDSQIVVNRANGSRPRKKKFQNARMDTFQNEVIEKSKHFEKVSFTWIPREQNFEADHLSKLGSRLK